MKKVWFITEIIIGILIIFLLVLLFGKKFIKNSIDNTLEKKEIQLNNNDVEKEIDPNFEYDNKSYITLGIMPLYDENLVNYDSNNNDIIINKAGTYEISGELNNGSIVIKDVDAKLIFQGVSINNSYKPAIKSNKSIEIEVLNNSSINVIYNNAIEADGIVKLTGNNKLYISSGLKPISVNKYEINGGYIVLLGNDYNDPDSSSIQKYISLVNDKTNVTKIDLIQEDNIIETYSIMIPFKKMIVSNNFADDINTYKLLEN